MYRTPHRVTREDIAEIYDNLGDAERAEEVREIERLGERMKYFGETVSSIAAMRKKKARR